MCLLRLFVIYSFCFFALSSRANGFIANKNQIKDQTGNNNENVLFVAQCGNLQIQLRKTGYSYEVFSSSALLSESKTNLKKNFQTESPHYTISRIDVDFQDCATGFKVETENVISAYNYYLNGAAIHTDEFRRVVYKNVYPFIDVEFLINNSHQNNFKYNVILHPGADISALKLFVSGANAEIRHDTLMLKHQSFVVTENIPLCYFLKDGRPVSDVKFNLSNKVLGFTGPKKIETTMVIDPISNLMWGTYQGGNGTDITMAMAADGQDNLYVTGYTNSAGNLATGGAFQTTLAGSLDIFLAKFTKAGQRVWTTYFGSTGVDIAYAICVKPDGTCYLGGATNSTVNLATPGAHQTIYGGGINDIVIAAFDANGQRQWASYYGGSAHDITQGITYDKVGSILFTGHTESTSNIATTGAYKTFYNFNYDVCLVKFTPSGQRVWGTYYGDSGVDEAYAICTDSQANIYITGITSSITDIATASAHQQLNAGASDAFIAKMDSAGKTLLFGTFYGGTNNEAGTAIKCNGQKLIVGGNTSSSLNIATTGAQQTIPGSADDAFLAAFTLGGTRLWATYIGGEDTDYLNGIELDASSQIYVCGATASSINISTASAWQASLASVGNYDAFLARYTANGAKQLATYYGGEGNDQAHGIAVDNLGQVYLAGETTSSLGIASSGAFQTTNATNTDAFLAKFCIPYTPKVTPTKSISICPGSTTLSATQGYLSYLWSNAASASSISVTHTAIGSYTYALQVNNGPNCIGYSDTTLVKVVSCLGVDDFNEALAITLFPNPTQHLIYLKVDDNLGAVSAIKLYNCRAELLEQQVFATEISVAHLPAGLYVLQLLADGKVYSRKFIKQ